jgi:hypothetical protein
VHEPIECPSEALAPPGKAMKGHRWLYSEENGCVACRCRCRCRCRCCRRCQALPQHARWTDGVHSLSSVLRTVGHKSGRADLWLRHLWLQRDVFREGRQLLPCLVSIDVFCSPGPLEAGLQCEVNY